MRWLLSWFLYWIGISVMELMLLMDGKAMNYPKFKAFWYGTLNPIQSYLLFGSYRIQGASNSGPWQSWQYHE